MPRVYKDPRGFHLTPQQQSRTRSRTLPRGLASAAWVSFVLNVLIIATGGAVRLTGSGLGCSEWPLCTPDSLVPTPETGIHGIIEFANRTISGPLLIAAVVVLWLTWRIRSERRDLFVLATLVLVLVIVQALVGAFVVWEELAATLVGFHYTASLIIVAIAAAYLIRMFEGGGSRVSAVPQSFVALSWVMTLGIAIVIVMGVMTTASGPHSGDKNVIREGFDATLMSHLHAWPGYVTLAIMLALTVWAAVKHLRPFTWLAVTLIVFVVQILIGIYQARNGLPPISVGVHMVLAALAGAATTATMLRLYRPITVEG